MEYNRLLTGISDINRFSQMAVARAVNQTLTLRNWLIGAYSVEYEQNGVDRVALKMNLHCRGKMQSIIRSFSLQSPGRICWSFVELAIASNELSTN